MKREYRITRNTLGYIIYKKREIDGMMELYFLGPKDKRIVYKDAAKTYYNKEDALSALVINKVRDAKNTD